MSINDVKVWTNITTGKKVATDFGHNQIMNKKALVSKMTYNNFGAENKKLFL